MSNEQQAAEIVAALSVKLNKTLNVLTTDYMSIRAGRANPHVLDKVMVDYYGSMTPISQVASISVQEGRCLVIAPWDMSILKAIEKAILVSNVGITPTNDGKVIRLVFPELTQERRKELGKQVKRMGEDSRIAVRNIRREAMDALKKLKNDKVISEDECAQHEKNVENAVTDIMRKIDQEVSGKEKEIMTI